MKTEGLETLLASGSAPPSYLPPPTEFIFNGDRDLRNEAIEIVQKNPSMTPEEIRSSLTALGRSGGLVDSGLHGSYLTYLGMLPAHLRGKFLERLPFGKSNGDIGRGLAIVRVNSASNALLNLNGSGKSRYENLCDQFKKLIPAVYDGDKQAASTLRGMLDDMPDSKLPDRAELVAKLAELLGHAERNEIGPDGDFEGETHVLTLRYIVEHQSPGTKPQFDCPECEDEGWVTETTADPNPDGSPGEPYQIQVDCPSCRPSPVRVPDPEDVPF